MEGANEIYDFIVIGGGTSGAAVARRWAEAKTQYTACHLEADSRSVSCCTTCSLNMFQFW